ncbi:probable myosin-binding protein 4 isoform X2 [Papaver somniferum]|uniref:probable myosin-binding protein 4 isoform X2 n=1 Tax=Papaver somniferum TaxID=3469 RepID=UPI000E705EEC|nr:probable myosin-binding protein 4 isoform X2 [Papaver somniferum]
MDTKMSSSHGVRVNPPGIKACLTSAVLEWFLIGLLYINALLSYVITKFARSFKLQTPCLLCSRLDHVVGDEKPGFYKDLICSTHQLEVSSLVFCHVHNKIADVHGLCESCLFSFATERKSNPETFRLLVGKLGTDLTDDETKVIHSSNERQCTCCTELFNSRLYTQGFLQMKSIEPDVGELNDPFPRSVRTNRSLSINGLKNKKRLTTPKSVNWSGGRSRSFDPLTTVGYTEVKITSDSETEAPFSDALGYTEVKLTSDSESEVPFSDEDQHHNYVNDLVSEKHGLEKEFVGKFVEPDSCTGNPEKSPRNVPNDLVKEKLIHQDSIEKLIHQDSMPEHLILFPDVQLDVGKPQSSATDVGHGLEELNWHQEQESNPSMLSEPLHDVPPPPDSCETVVNVSEKTFVKETSEGEEPCKLERELITEVGPELNQGELMNETSTKTTKLIDLSDAYKLALSNKGNQVSSSFAEQLTPKGSVKVTDELKLLLSQLSAARGIDLPNDMTSPRILGNAEEFKNSEASSEIGMQILQKRITLERNESNLSLDGSIVSEIEGESIVDRLKRQVEYDRKSMNALYKELEEERNASAIAANQAMAMITRLQEEKATLHMEALQYLRMMEEQSEYDVEAIQKAHDLLATREKEVQDLEAELEIYREKCESNFPPNKDYEDINKQKADSTHEEKDLNISKECLIESENERLYITECMDNGVQEEVPNSEYSENKTHDTSDQEQIDGAGKGHKLDGVDSSKNKETDLVPVLHEVSELNERLKALEADRSFLEHMINSRDDGVQFIQKIAHHLQGIREMGIRRDHALL